MPFKDKEAQATWLRNHYRKKALVGRTCETCGERPAERHHRASEGTRTIVVCNPCHGAIVPMMSHGLSPACCGLQAENPEPEAVTVE